MNKVTPKTAAKLIYELLDGQTEDNAKDIIKSIVAFLVKHNLVKKEAEIIEQFTAIFNSKNDIVQTEISVADEVDAETKKAIIDHISKITDGKKIEADIKIDKSKLGGFTFKIGDKIHDRTIKKNINELKNILNK